MKSVESISKIVNKIESSHYQKPITIYFEDVPAGMTIDEYIASVPELKGNQIVILSKKDLGML